MEDAISLTGLLINIVLSLSKLIIGFLSRSSAILADGIHSGMDVISSLVNYIGVRTSKKPADEKHPYGHYKAEVISGFIITIILFLTGAVILYESFLSFLNPAVVIVSYLSVGVMAGSAVVNEIMARVKIFYGKKNDNISLISDGVHSRIDVLSSFAVIIGLLISDYFIYADSIIAFLIGIYITVESFRLGKRATDSLMDISADEETENEIKKIIHDEHIILNNLKTQKRGSKIFAYIDINLPSKLSVEDASSITRRLEKTLTSRIKNLDNVVIQISSHEIKEGYYTGLFGRFNWHGKGKMHGNALGPGGFCICPSCNYRTEHQKGVPCSSLKCPKCGSMMTRGE